MRLGYYTYPFIRNLQNKLHTLYFIVPFYAPSQDELAGIRDMGRGWSPPAPSLWSRKPSSPAPQSEVVWKPRELLLSLYLQRPPSI